MTVAALDCGTNSTRLLVVDDEGRALVRDMRITRLGQGVDATGVLADEALARTWSVLEEYHEVMVTAGVRAARLVATSAVRDATNGQLFLDRAAEITGAEVALLTGVQEAEMSLRGATSDLAPVSEPTMIVDIGGGSTELAARVDGDIVRYSMQLGCVRVTERVLGARVVTPATSEAARAMITSELDAAFGADPRFSRLVGSVRIVGLAGTVATLAQLVAGLSTYDRDSVHHRRLTRRDVVEWRDRLGALEPAERLPFPGMVPGREDVLPAGLFILDAILERFEVEELLSSENDILDGLAASIVAPS